MSGSLRAVARQLTGQELIRLLVDEKSLEILRVLAEGEQDVSTLADLLFKDIASVSRQITELDEASLIDTEREGKRKVCRIGHRLQATLNGDHLRMVLSELSDGSHFVLNIHVAR